MTTTALFGSFSRAMTANRFYLLLASSVLFIIVEPMVAENLFLAATLTSILLISATGCLKLQKAGFVASQWFGIMVLVVGWAGVFSQNVPVQVTIFITRVVFLSFVTGALIYQIAISKEVTGAVIVGAIDGYLLLGIMGAVAFGFAEHLSPGSIRGPAGHSTLSDSLYLSFITLSTAGYGDFTPATHAARMISVFLAVSGPLYLAILIALLVGKLSSGERK